MTKVRVIAAAAVLSVLAVVTPAYAAGAASEHAPTFVVTLRSGEPREVAADHARRYGAQVEFVYEHALRGYAARVSEGQIGALARDGRVARVERDQVVHATGTQPGATWGIDRIDARAGTDGTYSYSATGAGVTAYVIDTGILTTHEDFGGGRASHGYDFISGDADATDCNGHGTHVAGTIGGTEWGVAKDVSLVGVRVLDCRGSGSWSGVIAGIDWVTADAVDREGPAVANMSLGGGASSSVDAAVQRSIASGVSYAIAAGNGDRLGRAQDACNYSPARVPEAMTIGATTKADAKTSWSNYGACVDWFAPGASITSAWYTSNTATNTISGTSMAAPHVAGAAALYLQRSPSASAGAVRDALFALTTQGIVTDSRTKYNNLLFTDPVTTGTGNTAPAASFTKSCSGLTCTFTSTASDFDGTIATHAWTFGDGQDSSEVSPTHTYATGGTYTVTLTVTDDDGATGSFSDAGVAVAAPSTAGFSLSANGYKVKGFQTVDLKWSGASSSSASVDVQRNGTTVVTTANDGAYIDEIRSKGGGSYTYKVCEADTTTCSNEVTVTF